MQQSKGGKNDGAENEEDKPQQWRPIGVGLAQKCDLQNSSQQQLLLRSAADDNSSMGTNTTPFSSVLDIHNSAKKKRTNRMFSSRHNTIMVVSRFAAAIQQQIASSPVNNDNTIIANFGASLANLSHRRRSQLRQIVRDGHCGHRLRTTITNRGNLLAQLPVMLISSLSVEAKLGMHTYTRNSSNDDVTYGMHSPKSKFTLFDEQQPIGTFERQANDALDPHPIHRTGLIKENRCAIHPNEAQTSDSSNAEFVVELQAETINSNDNHNAAAVPRVQSNTSDCQEVALNMMPSQVFDEHHDDC